MLIGFSTLLSSRKIQKSLWLIACLLLFSQFVNAQVITIPAGNTNDTATRKPLGCFYGYERTAMIFTSSEIGQGGSITKVGFYLNSKSNPAAATPVVIRMKTFSSNTFNSVPYNNLSNGSTIVYSGVITSDMLVANNWITITLNNAFTYNNNNLLVLVETNYGEFGGENYNAKQFRHSTTSGNRCQFWEDDLMAPTDYGVLSKKRPTVQLTFEPNCSGTPNPGNTLSTSNLVCVNELFTLSLQNTPTTPGLSYVWQSSPNGNNPWTTINGAIGSTLTTTQATSKYYRCTVTCDAGGASATSTPIQIGENPIYECYCASYSSDISDSKIVSFQMADISTSTDPGVCESYTDYSSTPGNVTAGEEVTIKINNGSCSGFFYDSYAAVYIDFNQNGIYDGASELVYGYGPTTGFNTIPDYTFIFPVDAPGGTTGMRVILIEGDSVPIPCSQYTYGETEDYVLNITAATPCAGAPAPGATLSSAPSVCANEQFTLSIANYQFNTGITYQWQTSADNVSYSDIIGATSASRVQSQTQARWYRCRVTCSNSGLSTNSDAIQINMNPFYVCYCSSNPANPEDTKIDSVKIGTLIAGSSPTECETYTNNTALSALVDKTAPVTIHIDNGSCSNQFYEAYVAVYIDYNHNQAYDPNELVYSYGPTIDLHSVPDGVFNIPGLVPLGLTGMRVIIAESPAVPGACGTYDWGETEDYVLNIVDQPVCVVPPTGGVASASAQVLCPGDIPAEIILSLTGNSTGYGQTYQWESSPDNIDYTEIAGATATTDTMIISNTTYFRCRVNCSGNIAYSSETLVEVKGDPAGNTEADAIPISSFPYADNGNNFGYNCFTSNYTNLTQQASPDVFYAIALTTADTSGTLSISTCETTDFNTYLHLVDDQGNHLSSNNNNGPLCTGDNASIEYYVESVPVNLFIVVEGQGTDEGNYTLNVDYTPDIATGTVTGATVQASNHFSVYPNPSDGNLNLQVALSNKESKVATLNIYNNIGQLVQTQQVNLDHGKFNNTLQLNAALPAGIYNLQLNDGNSIVSKPVVIQR